MVGILRAHPIIGDPGPLHQTGSALMPDPQKRHALKNDFCTPCFSVRMIPNSHPLIDHRPTLNKTISGGLNLIMVTLIGFLSWLPY